MAVVQAKDLAKSADQALTKNSEYHYSPYSSNCLTCDVRTTSRRYKELEAQKSVVLCGPFATSEDVCHSPEVLTKEIHRTKLRVVITNRRVKVFGNWTEEKLLAVLTDRLLQRSMSVQPRPYEKIPPLAIQQITTGLSYNPIVHRGIYSENILEQLRFSGASESVVVRAMKFGLRHLKAEDLNYFLQFGVSVPALRSRKLWCDLIDESLVISLRTMGFDENTSRKITLNGMLGQHEACLIQLMLAGVDVPGIFNWQGPTIKVGTRMIQFLRKIGINDDVLQLIVQKGIDEETHEMLKDLGYAETEAEAHPRMQEVVTCECDLTILEPDDSVPESLTCADSSKSSISQCAHSKVAAEAKETCTCFPSRTSLTKSSSSSTQSSVVVCKAMHHSSSQLSQADCIAMQTKEKSLTNSELIVQRNAYLRQTVMAPLVWAVERALQHKPTDPKYYIACQLLRWNHGGVGVTEMKEIEDFVKARTMEMDKISMEHKQRDEAELRAKDDKETLENIPCQPCKVYYQIHHVKKGCWKCIKKWIPDHAPCELPDICSSCKMNFSDISNSVASTSTSNGSVILKPSMVNNEPLSSNGDQSFISSSPHSYTDSMESSSYHRNLNTEISTSDASQALDNSSKSIDPPNTSPTTVQR